MYSFLGVIFVYRVVVVRVALILKPVDKSRPAVSTVAATISMCWSQPQYRTCFHLLHAVAMLVG